MSLQISPELLKLAENSDISDNDIVGCVATSLPFAHIHIMGVVAGAKESSDHWFAHEPEQITDEERSQMLRAYASNAIRGAYERIHGVKLVFQNCHRGGAFMDGSNFNTEAYNTFTSSRSQILAQGPGKVHC